MRGMRRPSVALLAFLAAAGVAAAQTPPAAWVTYKSPDGEFSLRFPIAPQTTVHDGQDRDGKPLKQQMLSSDLGNSAFQLGYFEILPDQEFSLAAGRDGMVSNVGGTLISQTAITIGPYPGLDLVIMAAAQGQPLVIYARIVQTPKRAYVIQTLHLSTAPYQLEQSARFFSSFQIR
jgi:hypothetical protein